jgi:iron complex outermembrane receptor protein
VDRNRSNFAIYADAEYDVTSKFLVSLAGRFEKYSDFGNTFNVKAATRLKLSDNIGLRGSLSTGFRAPSLVQIYYNLRFTAFVDGNLSETLLAANNSDVARQFGIPNLKQEEAFNAALGVTFNAGDFSATIDGYHIAIQDRIVLTGYFDAPNIDNVDAAAFFVNAVDTKTTGLDIVLNWRKSLVNGGNVSATLAGNVNHLKVDKINGSAQTPTDVLFGSREQGFLKASAPPTKFTFTASYSPNRKYDVRIGLTRFSKVDIDFDNDTSNGADTSYDAKIVTDLTTSYQLSDKINIAIGSNNLFNVYPSQQDPDNTDGGGYWDSVQMGFSGAYYFARIGFSF